MPPPIPPVNTNQVNVTHTQTTSGAILPPGHEAPRPGQGGLQGRVVATGSGTATQTLKGDDSPPMRDTETNGLAPSTPPPAHNAVHRNTPHEPLNRNANDQLLQYESPKRRAFRELTEATVAHEAHKAQGKAMVQLLLKGVLHCDTHPMATEALREVMQAVAVEDMDNYRDLVSKAGQKYSQAQNTPLDDLLDSLQTLQKSRAAIINQLR